MSVNKNVTVPVGNLGIDTRYKKPRQVTDG
jgi:hypothetical protein